jgi:hypothetical protein
MPPKLTSTQLASLELIKTRSSEAFKALSELDVAKPATGTAKLRGIRFVVETRGPGRPESVETKVAAALGYQGRKARPAGIANSRTRFNVGPLFQGSRATDPKFKLASLFVLTLSVVDACSGVAATVMGWFE